MDIIEKAIELGELLQQDDRYIDAFAALDANDNNETLQELLQDFNVARADLNREERKENPDLDKLSELDRLVNELYNAIMTNESMMTYMEAKAELDSLISNLNQILMFAASGQNPADALNQTGGCGPDGCAGCSGCSSGY